MPNTEQGVKVRLGVTVDQTASSKLHEVLDAAERRTKRVLQGLNDVNAGASNATKNALDRNLKAIQHHYDDINDIIERNGTKLSVNVLSRADKVTASIANTVNDSQRSLQNIVTGGQGGGGFGIGRQILGAAATVVGVRGLSSVLSETVSKGREFDRIVSEMGQRFGSYSSLRGDLLTGGRGWFSPVERANLQGRIATAAGTGDTSIHRGLLDSTELLTKGLGIGDKGETIADLIEALRSGGIKPGELRRYTEQIAKATGLAGELARTQPGVFIGAMTAYLSTRQRVGPIGEEDMRAALNAVTRAYQFGPATAANIREVLPNMQQAQTAMGFGGGQSWVKSAQIAAILRKNPNATAGEIQEAMMNGGPQLIADTLRMIDKGYGQFRDPALRRVILNKALSDMGGGQHGTTEGMRIIESLLSNGSPNDLGIAGGRFGTLNLEGFGGTPGALDLLAKAKREQELIDKSRFTNPVARFGEAHPWLQVGGAMGITAAGTWGFLKAGGFRGLAGAAGRGLEALPDVVGGASRVAGRLATGVGRISPYVLMALESKGLYDIASGGKANPWISPISYWSNRAGHAIGADTFLTNPLYDAGRMFGPDYESSRYAEKQIGQKGYGGGVSPERFESFMAALAGNESGGVKGNRYGARGPVIPGTAGERALGKYQMRLGTARQYSGNRNLTEDEFLGDPDLQESTSRSYVRYLLSKHHGDMEATAKEYGGFVNADPSEYLAKLNANMGGSMGGQHVTFDLTPDAQKLIRIVNLQGRIPEMRPH